MLRQLPQVRRHAAAQASSGSAWPALHSSSGSAWLAEHVLHLSAMPCHASHACIRSTAQCRPLTACSRWRRGRTPGTWGSLPACLPWRCHPAGTLKDRGRGYGRANTWEGRTPAGWHASPLQHRPAAACMRAAAQRARRPAGGEQGGAACAGALHAVVQRGGSPEQWPPWPQGSQMCWDSRLKPAAHVCVVGRATDSWGAAGRRANSSVRRPAQACPRPPTRPSPRAAPKSSHEGQMPMERPPRAAEAAAAACCAAAGCCSGL